MFRLSLKRMHAVFLQRSSEVNGAWKEGSGFPFAPVYDFTTRVATVL